MNGITSGPVFIGIDGGGFDNTGYAVTNCAGECVAWGESNAFTDVDMALLYGLPGVVYHGLLTQPLPYRPTPPGTMTRQRRRAEARVAAKR